jgi:hypothetical protein
MIGIAELCMDSQSVFPRLRLRIRFQNSEKLGSSPFSVDFHQKQADAEIIIEIDSVFFRPLILNQSFSPVSTTAAD